MRISLAAALIIAFTVSQLAQASSPQAVADSRTVGAPSALPSSCFVFRDSSSSISLKSKKNWTEAEKAIFKKTLKECAGSMPRILARALFCKPIEIYRISDDQSVVDMYAYSVRNSIRLVVLDRFFDAPELTPDGLKFRVWILSHELAHLADIGHVVDESAEWKSIASGVLKKANAAIGSIQTGSERRKICIANGVPSVVALQNARELLAEYISARSLSLKVVEPPAVHDLLEAKFYSDKIGADFGSVDISKVKTMFGSMDGLDSDTENDLDSQLNSQRKEFLSDPTDEGVRQNLFLNLQKRIIIFAAP